MNRKKYLEDLARFLPAMKGDHVLNYLGGRPDLLRRVLRIDEAKGLITVSTELVREHQTPSPLAVIKPGDPLPSVYQLARLAEKRWLDAINPTLVIRGTAKLAALYGGEVQTQVTANISHDLALVDVFISKRHDPDFQWTLVHARPGTGALPDAIAASGLIELVGRYNGASLAAKLAMAGKVNLELW